MATMKTLTTGALAGVCLVAAGAMATAATHDSELTPAAQAFKKTDRSTTWSLVDKVSLDFPTYHPQGFAVVGDRIFMSTVEIIERPVKYPTPVDGYDRSPGRGVGHVLVMTRSGELIKDIEVGEGDMYHPGGIDFDGESVWVPVAEYRPNSASVVYRIDADDYRVKEAFRFDDHVGGVVRDRTTDKVHGVSWGSRTFYTWTPRGRRLDSSANPSHLVDYQDCEYAGDSHQLCSGITELPTAAGGTYELGGLALTRLSDDRIVHEVPFPYFSSAGHVATRNPVALETVGSTLRLLAAPDDAEEGSGTELLVYEASS
jgi:hypothetical protein